MSVYHKPSESISKIVMVTIISGTSGGIVSTFTKPFIMRTYGPRNRYDIAACTNGMLAGLVSITGVCNRVDPWAAWLIGITSSFVYGFSCRLLKSLNIDDPIEAAPVHGFCGLWGTIAVGIFDNKYGLLTGNPGCA